MMINRAQRYTLMSVALLSMGLALVLIIGTGLPQRADYSGFILDGLYVAPEIGGQAPSITAPNLNGKALDWVGLRGQSVIVNFWATWCIPCAVEMPELQDLHETREDVEIVAVNIGEGHSVIADWVSAYELSFTIIPDPQQILYRQYRVIGQPTTYVINPDGIITHILYGATTAHTLATAIDTHQQDG
ncbi:MAG: TlpA family protein disulfide reductase [Anaerolineae bacterium]